LVLRELPADERVEPSVIGHRDLLKITFAP